MRAFLASAVGVACAGAAVLALPPASSAEATPLPPAYGTTAVPGGTRFVPLTALAAAGRALAAVPQGLPARTVAPFSMLGITWDDPDADLHGNVQVRTRSTATGSWSPWWTLEPNADLPDLDSPDRSSGRTRGGTAPLWVGNSNGVQVRVTPHATSRAAVSPLPQGLRLDMVDPGSAHAAPRALVAPGYRDRHRRNHRHFKLRPRITTRTGWGADEQMRESNPPYSDRVKAIFIHHTDSANDYDCSDAPAIIRAIYRYHVKSEGWRDIGYNFLVDKCGKIYEGRAGGVSRPVVGAHTLGFNTDTAGIAVIGEFTHHAPSRSALRALERLAAWKLSLTDVDARSMTTLVSRGSNRYRKGAHIRFHVISGHRDGFVTDCPGDRLYAELDEIRKAAATLQRTGHFDDHTTAPSSQPGDESTQQGDAWNRPGEDPWDGPAGPAGPPDDLAEFMREVMD